MRTIWHSDTPGARLLRLIFAIVSFVASFYVLTKGLTFLGVGKGDADGVGFIVALVSASFVMYG